MTWKLVPQVQGSQFNSSFKSSDVPSKVLSPVVTESYNTKAGMAFSEGTAKAPGEHTGACQVSGSGGTQVRTTCP